MMSQQEQEREREDAASYLSVTRWTVRRCEHESCEATALWVMDGDKQIGSISRAPTIARQWVVQKMHGGQPVSHREFPALLEAAAYAVANF